MKKLYNKKYNTNRASIKSDMVLLVEGKFKLNESVLGNYRNNKVLTGVISYKIFKNRESRDLLIRFYNFSEVVYNCRPRVVRPYNLLRREYTTKLSRHYFETRYRKDINKVQHNILDLYNKSILLRTSEVGTFKNLTELASYSLLANEFGLISLNIDSKIFLKSRVISIFSSSDKKVI